MNRQQIYFLSALAGVTLLGMYLHVRIYTACTSRLQSLNQQLRDIAKVDGSPPLRKQLDRLRDEARTIAKAVPEDDSVAELLNMLTRDLDELDTLEPSWKIGSSKRVGPHKQIPIDLSFGSTFPMVHTLLNRIEAYPRLTRVDRLQISYDDTVNDYSVRVTMRLNAFAHDSDLASVDGDLR